MIGDFNEAMWDFEHLLSRMRHERQMLDFREILSHCNLHGPGFKGLPWTCDNKQSSERNVRVRLDGAVASPSWSAWFPNAVLKHIVSSRSDHCPIFLDLEKENNPRPMQRIARYEIMWKREESLPEEIMKARQSDTEVQDLGDIARTLQKVMKSLKNSVLCQRN
jgi:hypothetical protein